MWQVLDCIALNIVYLSFSLATCALVAYYLPYVRLSTVHVHSRPESTMSQNPEHSAAPRSSTAETGMDVRASETTPLLSNAHEESQAGQEGPEGGEDRALPVNSGPPRTTWNLTLASLIASVATIVMAIGARIFCEVANVHLYWSISEGLFGMGFIVRLFSYREQSPQREYLEIDC